jgi:beta-N-acetylhexosaminidase
MTTPAAAILGCEGAELGADEAAFFRAADPWGFILFARNVQTPQQLRRLTDALRAAVGRAAPIFIDQEGGRVQRLRAPHWREWPDPLVHARAAGPMAGRAMALRHRLIAAELRAVGIDANCAPTCDIAGPATHPFLHDRCLGTSADEVTQRARAAAEGLRAGGVMAVAKHIPGHGRAAADSHHSLPQVDADADSLSEHDFAPFRALADLPAAMTAHVLYSALDPHLPATLSPRIIGLIRDRIGFDGLLMTDDLSMGALAGGLEDLTRAALAAGCDVALHCNGRRPEMEAIITACGRLSAKGVLRAQAAQAWAAAPDPFDAEAALAELAEMGAGVV